MGIVKCACGCGTELEEKDKHGRFRKFISGHNGRKYDDRNEYKKKWVKENRPSVNKARRKRKELRKIKVLTEYSSGKCFKCGVEYDGSNGAIFHFHHRDPEEKDFPISKLLEYSDDLLKNEITKCDLMCSNCHLILHNGEF